MPIHMTMSGDEHSTSPRPSSSKKDVATKITRNNTKTKNCDDKVGADEIRHAVALAAEAASKAFGWDGAADQNGKKSSRGNDLSSLIPGYTAPMKLEAKSLKGVAGASLGELRKREACRDSTMMGSSISILNRKGDTFVASKVKTPSSMAMEKSKGRGGKIPTSFSSSFRKVPVKKRDNTAGSGWFGMNPTPMTDQLKTDLSIIRNRNYLDPKKFYKSADSQGKVVQVGTVIEGSSEFYSSRLAKRDRRQNLTEEIMADSNISNYAKRKYHEMQMERAKPMRKVSKRGRKRR